jgi:hypothetical protein
MLFPDPNVARCIKEERLRMALRGAEKARLIREAKGTKIANQGALASLRAGIRNLLPAARTAKQNRSPIKEGRSLGPA